jgi:hypothetical protein
MNHIENTVSTATVQQYLDSCMCIHCYGKPFTEQLPSDSLGIADMFAIHYQATHVLLAIVAQQQLYILQYYFKFLLVLKIDKIWNYFN